ncbi:hypothetical protein E8A74_16240 [Polyangium fumosum]|uniref:Uncharacterized protein n=1 Tax=Polyangium fumosum TaxID=889272 RepID=A0A4U1JDW5_9BACT|nr:hypothetical protein E8A74_16240 [Polyangium fumosum]
MPWVEVPDVSGTAGAFEPGQDPYAAYADAVIEALSQDVEGGKVVLRGDFVTNVRAWRSNTAAIEKALAARVSVSQVETSAFLQAQIRVTEYVRQYMDASDWFLDSPIPPDVRAQVDGVLKNAFAEMAEQMKESLNGWEAIALGPEKGSFMETVRAFAGAMSTVGEGAAAYAEVMQTLVHASSRIAIGFVPYAGPALDLCEAVTGKLFCLPGGTDLSTEERVGSAVGFGFGQITKAWAGIKAAGVKPGAKIVAAGVLNLGEEFAQALRGSRIEQWKGLRHAVTNESMNEFEKKAGLFLMKDKGHGMLGVGDGGVRKVLKIPKHSDPHKNNGMAADFLSLTSDGKLVLSEAKGIVSDTGAVDVNRAADQLSNAMEHAAKLNLANDVERVQIIIPKGAKVKGDWSVKDGYLRTGKGEPVTVPGKPNFFVRVVEI